MLAWHMPLFTSNPTLGILCKCSVRQDKVWLLLSPIYFFAMSHPASQPYHLTCTQHDLTSISLAVNGSLNPYCKASVWTGLAHLCWLTQRHEGLSPFASWLFTEFGILDSGFLGKLSVTKDWNMRLFWGSYLCCRLSYHQHILDIVPPTFSALCPANPTCIYKYGDESSSK